MHDRFEIFAVLRFPAEASLPFPSTPSLLLSAPPLNLITLTHEEEKVLLFLFCLVSATSAILSSFLFEERSAPVAFPLCWLVRVSSFFLFFFFARPVNKVFDLYALTFCYTAYPIRFFFSLLSLVLSLR